MRIRRFSVGESKLGCFIWLALLGIFVMVALKAVPVKISSSQLFDYMEGQAKFVKRPTKALLTNRILGKAMELDLPIKKKDIKVVVGGARVKMEVKYMVPLVFPGYTYEWDFEFKIDRPVFDWSLARSVSGARGKRYEEGPYLAGEIILQLA